MRTSLSIICIIGIILILPFGLSAQSLANTNPEEQSEELGKVEWYRNYDQAAKLSKESGKPILILFQEVPGCSTCRNYGHNVLSHPLMVEAIENEFIPLAIHNNKGGHDRKTLEQFKEPSWNNPVVRIVNSNGKDVVQRVAGNYSAKGLYQAMEKALNSLKKPIPKYMLLLGKEVSYNRLEEKYYSMYCFWSGEKHFGEAEGVVKAESGFMNHKEVVKVTYNPNQISEAELTKYAEQGSCRSIEKSDFHFSAKDHLYYLQHSNYKYLPLTDIQKTEINSALGGRKNASELLSPKQKEWLDRIESSNKPRYSLYQVSFEKAWEKLVNS